MVEMLTAHDMAIQGDLDQALADYRDLAIMVLSRRRTKDELDDAVSVLNEWLIKVQEHLNVIQRMMK